MAEWDDYQLFWKETLNQIREEKEEQEFSLWFNLDFFRATENQITLAVPSMFYRDQVQQRYKDYIESKLRALTGKNLSINFEIKPQVKAVNQDIKDEEVPQNKELGKKPGKSGNFGKVTEKKFNHFQLNRDYTFDTYVVGENNHFAHNAAQAIARNPGTTSYNPLLIYGGVGLGKTHLMQAIGNYIYDNLDHKIIYTTAENFTNEFIQSLNEKGTTAFKNKYRLVDVLLLDDIHFLEKKEGTQEELFHTFNALFNAKKQIVFTCDRPVSELKNLTDRLKSRFAQGLNVDLQPPNYETRCAILKNKVNTRGINIPDEVIALISKNISTNIRDLEGALNTLTAYAELVGKSITVDVALQQLKDVFASPKQTNMSIDIIIREVANYFSLSYNDLKGIKRSHNIVFPRQLAMYIAREITQYSTTEVGQSFGGRDHTTVMYSCKTIEERIQADPTLDSTIQNLIRLIKEQNAKS